MYVVKSSPAPCLSYVCGKIYIVQLHACLEKLKSDEKHLKNKRSQVLFPGNLSGKKCHLKTSPGGVVLWSLSPPTEQKIAGSNLFGEQGLEGLDIPMLRTVILCY
jgi:hypothetical protein